MKTGSRKLTCLERSVRACVCVRVCACVRARVYVMESERDREIKECNPALIQPLICSFLSHSQSDDNLLKNIELFDKLSLRFNGRILFIKDLIGNNEICCWTYYGNGKKLSEVCCTSIVYATEKKQTKVEFPEARIYEETLNVLLYENRGTGKQPDAELLNATQGAVGARVIHENEEEPRRHRASND